MPETVSLDAALARLDTSIDRLSAAVQRRRGADGTIADLRDEVTRLGEDRSRLALDLDGAMLRAGRLEDANKEVSRRLVAAMESIRAVLDAHGG
ncbi:DUF4164 domain-containing protein [Chthonobacter albigriseus]|uniref:DUF4164 domain-containing protein n=1 Tax=Chthonobacter albigriseus TaxID=1683161 RepID=UPI0015EEA1CB|nr:DUF4164 domain-containing protein [Chthonobacter albigriseus]